MASLWQNEWEERSANKDMEREARKRRRKMGEITKKICETGKIKISSDVIEK